MLPSTNLPVSFERVLSPMRQCFTAPTYQVFLVLFCGFVSAVGDHTVTGMLVASGYSTTWSHHRGHRFFSRARWCSDAVGMAVLDLIVDHLLPGGVPLELVVDDSLFKRSGPKVWGVFWHHDATSTSTKPVARGTCYIVVGVVVNVRFMTRAICLPVHVRLWTPKPKVNGKNGTGVSARAKTAKDCPSKVEIATAVVRRIAGRYPDRAIHVTGDAAYISRSQRNLPAAITWTSRLRCNAALFDFAPPRTGLRGRPKTKGERLPMLSDIAKNAQFTTREVHRYNTDGAANTTATVEVHAFTCLWYGVLANQSVKVVMVRDVGKDGYGIAIVSTDLHASDVQLIERYARRWSIEVTFEEGKHIAGVADARNRTRNAVQRTVPFGFYSMSILVVWFAASGVDHDVIVAERRRIAPWYTSKTAASFEDILNMARRVLAASHFRPTPSSEPTAVENEINRLTGDDLAA